MLGAALPPACRTSPHPVLSGKTDRLRAQGRQPHLVAGFGAGGTADVARDAAADGSIAIVSPDAAISSARCSPAPRGS